MTKNLWTSALVTAGVISTAAALRAEESVNPVMKTLESTTISGYVDTSAIALFGSGSGQRVVYGRSFDGPLKQQGFNLNVVSLTVEKPLDDGNWSAGYKAQMLFGPDANTLGSLSTFGSSSGDFAVKNAYVSLRAPLGNGLDFKVGVWDTIIGYEVFEAGNNPNYSRSYGYYIEPLIHTGLLAQYKISDLITIMGGIANGIADRSLANQIDSRAQYVTSTGTQEADTVLSYMGAVVVTLPEGTGFLKGATIYGGAISTGFGSSTDTVDYDGTLTGYGSSYNIVNFYGGATIPTPWEKLSVGAAYDYRANGLFNDSYENAVAGYISLKLSEKLTLNARGDYATGSAGKYGTSGGVTYNTVGAYGVPAVRADGSSAINALNGDHVELLSVVGTLNYALFGNAITRLEVRWDHDLTGTGIFLNGNTSGNTVTAAGTAENALSVSMNFIYKF